MRWGRTNEERLGWQWWFAWKPVQVQDGRWAWMEGVSRIQKPSFDTAEKPHYIYRWWEDHVRAKMEGTDDPRPSPGNPLGVPAASQVAQQRVVFQPGPIQRGPAIKLTPADLPDEYRCKIVEVE